jgi:hypothetical protein
MPMKRSIELAAGVLQAVEFVVFTGAATILVAIGPPIWLYRLFTADRIAMAIIVAISWLGSVFTIALEVRRKAITAVSLGVFFAWLIVLVLVFQDSLPWNR